MTAAAPTAALDVAELVATARQLRADAVAAPADADFSVHLDLAMTDAEFTGVLGEPFDAPGHWRRAVEALRTADTVGPWLYRGAAQVGWVGLRLGRTPPAAVDQLLVAWVDGYPRDCELDLPRGLLGIGVYALAHPDRRLAERLTGAVLDVLGDRASGPDGLAPRSLMAGGARLVGLAHGAAGLVAYLAAVVRSGLPSAERAAGLLDAALAWLLRCRRAVGPRFPPAGAGALPPAGADPSPDPLAGPQSLYPRAAETVAVPARSAWCHGDPGIWLGLAAAAAAEAADAVLTREPEYSGVVDATICHGAAGLLWINDRIRRATADPRAADRVAMWADRLRAERSAGPLRYLGPTGTMIRDHSFLSGDAGAALVLLAVATGTRPAWEQLLLGAW